MPWGVPARGDSGPLIPPHLKNRRTFGRGFIDLVGQNWPRNAGLRTPLHQTVIQWGLPPRWPQLSQIAWFSEKKYIFHDKEAFSDNNVYILHPDSDYFIVV